MRTVFSHIPHKQLRMCSFCSHRRYEVAAAPHRVQSAAPQSGDQAASSAAPATSDGVTVGRISVAQQATAAEGFAAAVADSPMSQAMAAAAWLRQIASTTPLEVCFSTCPPSFAGPDRRHNVARLDMSCRLSSQLHIFAFRWRLLPSGQAKAYVKSTASVSIRSAPMQTLAHIVVFKCAAF